MQYITIGVRGRDLSVRREIKDRGGSGSICHIVRKDQHRHSFNRSSDYRRGCRPPPSPVTCFSVCAITARVRRARDCFMKICLAARREGERIQRQPVPHRKDNVVGDLEGRSPYVGNNVVGALRARVPQYAETLTKVWLKDD